MRECDAIFKFDLTNSDDVCTSNINMSRRGGGRRDDTQSGANNDALGSGGGLSARVGSGGGGGSLLKPAYLQQGKTTRNSRSSPALRQIRTSFLHYGTLWHCGRQNPVRWEAVR